MASSAERRIGVQRERTLDATEVYDAHAEFVWRTLYRLGVSSADLADLLQEVFVVVHRRAGEGEEIRALRPWLYGICLGLVRNYRRRAGRRLERLTGEVPERSTDEDPESAMDARRRRERGQRLLRALDPEKRAVFLMFEVEGMSGKSIAEMLGVPLGTVHSRLHAARRDLIEGLKEES